MRPRGYGKGSDWHGNRYGGYGRGKGMTRPSWLNDGTMVKEKEKGKVLVLLDLTLRLLFLE